MSRNLTRRGFLVASGSALIALTHLDTALAFSEPKHDDILEDMIFSGGRPERNSEQFKLIEHAVQLCLDQSNGNNVGYIKELKDAGVRDIPDLSEIDFTANSAHRDHTHLGWKHDYSNGSFKEIDWQTRWEKRKAILVNTVDFVFDFGAFEEVKTNLLRVPAGSECEAFARLLYYIHIFGDFKQSVEEHKRWPTGVLPYAKQTADNQETLLGGIAEVSKTLFDKDGSNSGYSRYTRELTRVTRKAKRLRQINDTKQIDKLDTSLASLENCLQDHIPNLLRQQPFFSEVFTSRTHQAHQQT